MIRTYGSPLAFKEGLEARLHERAKQQGRSVHRVRQVTVMERYLARVFTAFDTAVLKGGLAMELRLERARATRDLDLRLVGAPAEILARLQAAGRLDLSDFLSFEVRLDPSHPTIEADGLRYEGQRFRVDGRLAGRPYGATFGVDVAIGEPLVGRPDRIVGSDVLAFIGVAAPTFLAYPVATHIAEKLHAYTLPRPRPNSRVKDLPDIALLAQIEKLDAEVLRGAIVETFRHRGTHEVPAVVPDPPEGWGPVYERMAREDGLPWGTLGELLAVVRGFLGPMLGGGGGVWEPVGRQWMAREG